MKIRGIPIRPMVIVEVIMAIIQFLRKSKPTKQGSNEKATTNVWDMMKYFSPGEFDSPDEPGSGLNMDSELLLKLDAMRGSLGIPLVVTSGYRTKKYNKELKERGYKAARDSSHLKGLAVDISVKNPALMYRVVDAAIGQGIGRIFVSNTLNYVHLDIDKEKPQGLWGK